MINVHVAQYACGYWRPTENLLLIEFRKMMQGHDFVHVAQY